ncbi:SDR family oxidoreductase [Nocardioides albertanoniae]|nr:SDR family oxidoreductase [Nocardioides albertanoniae]
MSGRHALVTGAASGIGRAVAEKLADSGAVLHITDLHEDGLRETRRAIEARGGIVATAHPADVSSLDDVRALAELVHAQTPAVDAVLNVAGIAVWGTVERLSHEQWRSAIEVNLMGPIHVIECFVPAMIHGGRGGHLVNVASAAALVGLPWHAPYSASKFGLRGISEVLRFDLARHRIAVTLVTPGAVATPLTGSVQIAGVDTTSAQFRRLRERFEGRAVSPEHAAERIVEGMLRGRYLVQTSRDIALLHGIQRYAPPVYALIMGVANRLVSRIRWDAP